MSSYHAEYYKLHKSAMNAAAKLNVQLINDKVFALLGNYCFTCRERRREFLTVDHIHSDRKKERSSNSLTWKRDILNGKLSLARYQVLCRNCNESKHRLNPVTLFKTRVSTGTFKKCCNCLLDKDTAYFSTSSYRGKKCLDSSCDTCTRFKLTTITVRCYDFLGGSCKCCGVNNPSMLNIDHIYNDGALRRSKGEGTGVNLCRRILNGVVESSDFQLLCANCNYSKLRNGSCVHVKEIGS